MGRQLVDGDAWVRSSVCSSDNNCVEVRLCDGLVYVRDSKDPGARPMCFSVREWADFVAGAVQGEFAVDGES